MRLGRPPNSCCTAAARVRAGSSAVLEVFSSSSSNSRPWTQGCQIVTVCLKKLQEIPLFWNTFCNTIWRAYQIFSYFLGNISRNKTSEKSEIDTFSENFVITKWLLWIFMCIKKKRLYYEQKFHHLVPMPRRRGSTSSKTTTSAAQLRPRWQQSSSAVTQVQDGCRIWTPGRGSCRAAGSVSRACSCPGPVTS